MSLLVVFMFVQVLHVPVCVDQWGWLCIQVNMYCIRVFMCAPTGNTCYWLVPGARGCGSLVLLMSDLATS